METCGYFLGLGDKAIPLHPGMRVSFGRDAENDYDFNDGLTSRFHAILAVNSDGAVTLEDLGSTNGTWLNEKRIESRTAVPLNSRDIFRVGGKVMTYYSSSEEIAPAFEIERFDSEGGTVRLDPSLANSVEDKLAQRRATVKSDAPAAPQLDKTIMGPSPAMPSGPSKHFTFEGNLTNLKFSQLLINLHRDKETGYLFLGKGGESLRIGMQEGKVLFAQFGLLSGMDALEAWGDKRGGDFVFEKADVKGLEEKKNITTPTVEIILRICRS